MFPPQPVTQTREIYSSEEGEDTIRQSVSVFFIRILVIEVLFAALCLTYRF